MGMDVHTQNGDGVEMGNSLSPCVVLMFSITNVHMFLEYRGKTKNPFV
jgi:hypothetical protein